MAITDAYALAADYKARVEKTGTADDTEIDSVLLAVSRLIDRETSRFFTRDVAVVARVYDGSLAVPQSVGVDDLSLFRRAIAIAAASITSKLSVAFTVTLALPLSVIAPSPSNSFIRLFTRSTDERSLYSLCHFRLSLGTGGCRLGSSPMGCLST